jgi:hypothetical protein
MSEVTIKADLGQVDVSALNTEEDFEREAQRLLPQVLEQFGRQIGETSLEEIDRAFAGTMIRPNNSPSERRRFIEEAGHNYRRDANAGDRRNILASIVAKLKEMKGDGAA